MPVNADRPNGFTPIGTMSGSPWSGYVRVYETDASEGTGIFIGDAVTLEADGNIAPAAAGEVVLGVCVGVSSILPDKVGGKLDNFLTNTQPALTTLHSAASTLDQVYVCVGPDVLYEVQEDGVTDPIEMADIGSNIELITTHAGSTATGRSGQEINSDSHVTGTAQFRLVDIVDRPDNEQGDIGSAGVDGDNCRWIVRINENHFTVIDDGGTVEGGEGI